jgi:hypothetical protein
VSEIFIGRQSCRLCLGEELDEILDLGSTPIGDKFCKPDLSDEVFGLFPLRLMICRVCGHVQLYGVVSPSVVYANYLYESTVSMGLITHFRASRDNFAALLSPRAGATICDIGANDGSFLEGFAELGMKCIGVEPAEALAGKMSRKGFHAHCGFFGSELAEELRGTHGPIDFVTANNVMANIDDMDDFARGVSRVLSDDGVFVFETGYCVSLVRNRVLDNVYHEHLSYFNIAPLVPFFRRHGLELIRVQQMPVKGGSIRVMVQRTGAARAIHGSVQEHLDAEAAGGFGEVERYLEFSQLMLSLRAEYIETVRGYLKSGKRVSVYGAAVGVTTMLYFYGFGSEEIDFCFDDSPLKHGLLCPGTHIPVFPSKEIYSRTVDRILLLPWRYASPIVRRHAPFLEAGGGFLLPLQEVREIRSVESLAGLPQLIT